MNHTLEDGTEVIFTSQPVNNHQFSVPKDSIKVLRAFLHQSLTLPALGATTTSLYTAKGVEMYYHTSGLYCAYKGEWFIVPLANVIAVYTTTNK